MSTNTLEQLKQAKSALEAERKPVSHVQEAVKATKDITQFVKIALSKENRWIFQAGEQDSIVSILAEINRTNKELYNKCRTPEHFNRDATRYLKMKNHIIRKSECIHFSLDQGFYATEPLGFSAGKAIELSLKQIRKIRDGHQQGKWTRLPIDVNADDSAKTEVEKIYAESAPLAEKLLKNENIGNFDPPMTIEEVQSVYKFFHNVHQIQELEQQALTDALSKKTPAEQSTPNEILDKLSSFERKLKNVRVPTSKNIPDWGIHLYEMSLTDMTLRMHLLRIPFEPLGFLNRHLKILEEQKDSDGIEKSISSFHDNAVQELEKLQLFSESFAGVDETLQEVTGILQNLSICFGKIYHNASSQTITNSFLIKVLELIKGMLEKGGRVADSKSDTLLKLHQSVNDVDLFDDPITEGMIHALDLLEQSKEAMSQYCDKLKTFLETLSNASDWDSRQTYKFLKNAYDENAILTSASMFFGSITKTCVLLKSSIKEVESMWLELAKLREQKLDSGALYEQTIALLGQDTGFSENSLRQRADQVEELNWILDEMLGLGVQEEQRFVDELHSELIPVSDRIKALRIKESARKVELTSTKEKSEQDSIVVKSKVRKTKKSDKSSELAIGNKKPTYDPFQPFQMIALKKACKEMTSSEGKMIYQVLTNTHIFFTLLNKMESSFKQGEGLENELEQDLARSKTTQEFLMNFARLKFLPNGYYSENNTPFDYNEEKRQFEVPEGIKKQLKITDSSTSSPMDIFSRLIRVLLGLDDSNTLAAIMPPQNLSIMEDDFMLKRKDRKAVEEGLQST